MSDEELLKKANLPAKKANKWHEFYKGKIESVPKCSINSYDDFAVWYTPGVAEPCKEISNNTADDLTDSCSLINPENDMGISQPAKSTNFAFDSTYFE